MLAFALPQARRALPAPRAAPLLQAFDRTSFDDGGGGFQLLDMDAELEDGLDDLEGLVAEWQEAQALLDETGAAPTAAQQEAMMASWRDMLQSREEGLRRQAKKGAAKSAGWVPAALTGWHDEGEVVRVSRVADEDAADAADEQFVLDWQLHAEQQRQREARQTRLTAPRRTVAKLFRREEGACVGIDLGTTNCAVAAIVGGKAAILPSPDDGASVTPSVVSFLGDGGARAAREGEQEGVAGRGRVLVGERAQRQQVTNPHSTYASTKRLIGRTASAEELRALAALDTPAKAAGREVLLACPALRTALSPVDVAAELLRCMREQAEASLGADVASAVVTVPAYFDEAQRAATQTACVLAGLRGVQLLREPEAAALTYAVGRKTDERVMVFDLGGGTFDVSIVDVGGGIVEVIATSGDPRVGGNDWDHALAKWLAEQFVAQHGVPVSGFMYRRLLDAAVEAKHALSASTSAEVAVPFLHGDKGLRLTLSRRKFEALTRPLLLRLVPPLKEVMELAGLQLQADIGTLELGDLSAATPARQQWQKRAAWRWQRMARRLSATGAKGGKVQRFSAGVPVSTVLLVGGATRMPSIGRFIKRMTGLRAKPVVDPEEAVALGAAVFAGVLSGAVDQRVYNPFFHDEKMLDLDEQAAPQSG